MFFTDPCNYLHWWRPVRLLNLPEGATRALQWKCVFPHLVACGARWRAHRRLGPSGHGSESYNMEHRNCWFPIGFIRFHAMAQGIASRFVPPMVSNVPRRFCYKIKCVFPHLVACRALWRAHRRLGQSGHGPESYKRVQGRASRRALFLRFCPTKWEFVPQKHKMMIFLFYFGSTNPVWFYHFSFGSTIFNLVQPITRFGSTKSFGSTKWSLLNQSTHNLCTVVEPFWFGWTILLSISGVLVQPIRFWFNNFVQLCCFCWTNRILVQPIILVQQRFV